MRSTGRRRVVDPAQATLFLGRLLRGANQLPSMRYEIFQRLFVQGQPVQRVREDLGLNEQQFETERSALLRSLMHRT